MEGNYAFLFPKPDRKVGWMPPTMPIQSFGVNLKERIVEKISAPRARSSPDLFANSRIAEKLKFVNFEKVESKQVD